jgi:hypothetical protein
MRCDSKTTGTPWIWEGKRRTRFWHSQSAAGEKESGLLCCRPTSILLPSWQLRPPPPNRALLLRHRSGLRPRPLPSNQHTEDQTTYPFNPGQRLGEIRAETTCSSDPGTEVLIRPSGRAGLPGAIKYTETRGRQRS